jgi:hypothetical protein
MPAADSGCVCDLGIEAPRETLASALNIQQIILDVEVIGSATFVLSAPSNGARQ